MQKVKFTPAAAFIVQFMPNTEIDAIQDEATGALYVPVYPSLVVTGSVDGATKVAPAKKPTAKDQEEEEENGDMNKSLAKGGSKPASKKSSAVPSLSEKEMMDMETEELEEILKEHYSHVKYDKMPGKNTNKKLRLLILAEQEATGTSASKEEEEESEESDELDPKKISKVLSDLDEGTIDVAKATDRLINLGVDEDAASKICKKFLKDSDMTVKDALALVMETEEEETEEEEEKEKPASKKGPGKKPKEEVVEIEDLELKDNVKVYWEDNEDYFFGVVSKIKGKSVTVKYEDDSEDVLDPENNTEIIRIS